MSIDAILFANETYYAAFAEHDFDAMDDLWARSVPVACIHPGWHALDNRDKVMESWRAILADDAAPVVGFSGAKAYRYGDVAFVTCYEQVGENFLIATNMFVLEENIWKMVHHQAGPTGFVPPFEDEGEPILMH